MPLGVAVLVLAILLRDRPVTLVLTGVGAAIAVAESGSVSPGSSALPFPSLNGATFGAALNLLYGLGAGLLVVWLPRLMTRLRGARRSPAVERAG